MVVQVLLKWREVTEYDMLVLDGEVFGKNIVGPTNDEFIYESEQFCKAFVATLTIGIGPCSVTATENRDFVFLAEFVTSSEVIGVGEV